MTMRERGTEREKNEKKMRDWRWYLYSKNY